MVVEMLAPYNEWKQEFLAQIEAQPNTTAKGDNFVQKVLQIYYNLSEEDSIDATDCSGAGDKGVDAVYIIPAEEDNSPSAIVVQGKYGTAGDVLDIYSESQKFLTALKIALNGDSVTPAVNKLAGVLKNGGMLRYVIVTVDPLDQAQRNDMSNVKKIANFDFSDKMVVEAISLENLYNVYTSLTPIETSISIKVDLPCQAVPVKNNAYVGVTSLTDIYGMLSGYASQGDGTIDSIYDHNIRKYLKRRSGSVNDGIYKTLETEPSRFIAYNNGITIICRSASTLQTATGLQLDTPYIVNGCQTTRTLYDFMNTQFAGIDVQRESSSRLQPYKEAFIAIKILVVKGTEGDSYANSITRFSNKQNTIRGKDFIALDDMYRKLKADLRGRGYFLETQSGEYDVLPKHKKMQFPRDTNVINAFEATLLYAAGVLGKPQDAFGRSGDFAPGGQKFEGLVNELTADSLFVPWMIAQQAQGIGYTKGKSIHDPSKGTGHRAQTRHLFQYMFFRIVREMISKYIAKTKVFDVTQAEMYNLLKVLMADYDHNPQHSHPFFQLLSLADNAVATYMALAEEGGWYDDRNAFLKGQELMQEDHLIMAITSVTVGIGKSKLLDQIQQIMSSVKS